MTVALLMAVGLAAALASLASDPKIYAGAECCACLEITAPNGDNLESTPVGERSAANCLPGDTAEDETCSEEVASQVAETGSGDPVRVLDPACYETYCKDDCASARDNGLIFTAGDGS